MCRRALPLWFEGRKIQPIRKAGFERWGVKLHPVALSPFLPIGKGGPQNLSARMLKFVAAGQTFLLESRSSVCREHLLSPSFPLRPLTPSQSDHREDM